MRTKFRSRNFPRGKGLLTRKSSTLLGAALKTFRTRVDGARLEEEMVECFATRVTRSVAELISTFIYRPRNGEFLTSTNCTLHANGLIDRRGAATARGDLSCCTMYSLHLFHFH